MANSVIKYANINGTLYKIEVYSYRGYAGSTHIGNTMTKVPDEEVEEIKKMLKTQETT